jgi:hypothetical protein
VFLFLRQYAFFRPSLIARFATILLYFTDLGETDGGETVFTEAWPTQVPVDQRKDLETVCIIFVLF